MSKFISGHSITKHPNITTKLGWWTYKKKYSHSYIIIEIDGVRVVYHCTGDLGAHLTTYEHFLKTCIPYREYEYTTDKTVKEMLIYCLEHKVTYGTLQMFGAGIVGMIRKLIGKENANRIGLDKNPFRSKTEEHCSISQGGFIEEMTNLDIPEHPSLWAPFDIDMFSLEQTKKSDNVTVKLILDDGVEV